MVPTTVANQDLWCCCQSVTIIALRFLAPQTSQSSYHHQIWGCTIHQLVAHQFHLLNFLVSLHEEFVLALFLGSCKQIDYSIELLTVSDEENGPLQFAIFSSMTLRLICKFCTSMKIMTCHYKNSDLNTVPASRWVQTTEMCRNTCYLMSSIQCTTSLLQKIYNGQHTRQFMLKSKLECLFLFPIFRIPHSSSL